MFFRTEKPEGYQERSQATSRVGRMVKTGPDPGDSETATAWWRIASPAAA
jgi:hypothetical protein